MDEVLVMLLVAVIFACAADAILALILCWSLEALWKPMPYWPIFGVIFVASWVFGGTKLLSKS